MPADTRQRILDTTAELFQRYGYNGTGLKQIVTEANAAFGSVYHFFPGGKEQLAAEVIRRSGRMYQELVEGVYRGEGDPLAGVAAVFSAAAAVLEETDYVDACPVATVALEVASSNETLRLVTAEVFDDWVGAATAFLAEGGITPHRARKLAMVLIELLEGAFVLGRAARSTAPVVAAGEAAAVLVGDSLDRSLKS
jgi:AcrR family transcriptional regulator